MHFVIHVFSNHAEVLYSVTLINLLDQSAVLSDGVVAAILHNVMPIVPLQTIDISIFQQPLP